MYFVPFAVETIKNERKTNNKIKILTIGKFEDRKNHLMLINHYFPFKKITNY